MKSCSKIISFLIFAVFLCGCAREKPAVSVSEPPDPGSRDIFSPVPVLGEFYKDPTIDQEFCFCVPFMHDIGNKTAERMNQIESAAVQGAEETLQVTECSFSTSEFEEQGCAYSVLTLYCRLPEEITDTIEVENLEIQAEGESYTFPVGKIVIHADYPRGDSVLSLKDHLGATFGRGLKLYGITFRNISQEPVTLEKIDLGVFAPYGPEVEVNGVAVDGTEGLAQEVPPGETIAIDIRFSEQPEGYETFLMGPLFTFRHGEDTVWGFAPPGSNGASPDDQDVQAIWESIKAKA